MRLAPFTLSLALLFTACGGRAGDQPPPADAQSTITQIHASLTPGFVTTLSYPAKLVCSASILRMTPEIDTRIVITGFGSADCVSDPKGRLRNCKPAAEDPPGHFFALAARRMALEGCHLVGPTPLSQAIHATFRFETTSRQGADPG
jgi:hypothetical protein